MRLHYHGIFNLLALATASVIPLESLQEVEPATPFTPARLLSRPTRDHRRRQSPNNVDVTFNQLVQTIWGESIHVVGSIAQLGDWDPSNGLSLNASQYTAERPLWSGTVSLPAGTSFSYKYIKIGTDGSLTWEADPNHSFTVPSNGGSVSDTWQANPPPSATTVIRAPTSTAATTTSAPTATCTNGPNSRRCWSGGFDIDTDFDQDWPETGRTVSYDFTITNTTMSPDGFERLVYAINGQYPGPTIYANWGDTIHVTVHNELEHNGTSIHWHGLRMWHKNAQDGVPGVTECPIVPGGSKTYTFTATQYGTSWYHSHFSNQYGDGILGPIVVYGPATADYDEDLGPLPITDWYYPTVGTTSFLARHRNALAPTADNGLINGTMTSNSGGSYARTMLRAGRRHRLRLINTAVDGHFMFSLDGHTMTVISADFVPLIPYNATSVFLGIGQRYDVIITADQAPGSYWFRADSQDTAGCGSNFNNGNIRSIFSYEGHENETPISTAHPYSQRCTDETQLVPYWNSFVPVNDIPEFETLATAINQSTDATGLMTIFWQVNGTPLRVDWSQPSLGDIENDPSFTAWPDRANVISLPNANRWTYWVITEAPGSPFTVDIPHPIHLHGHDFYVLGAGERAWTDDDRQGLNYENPMRRDSAMLPTNGWLAIAFETNNPGAWLMHCHIAWHADDGFAVQFIESQREMLDINPLPANFNQECNTWRDYYPEQAEYLQSDSGI
ncbi:carbohydrate-binding module family 20 protein [Cercospora zeae-maydis SCOH1-5]|uniref:laccase n=1 Tax=Cercospora zeae-maydis SCOH1-5 TaxID=717836 RepID=A0A6A6FVH3_9PEZI|nr:carbohydrate-binding module family 20 protein [Cercospora zeae-maydis SCOH1-5]